MRMRGLHQRTGTPHRSAATRTGPLPARARDLDQEHPQSEQGTGTIGPARHSSRHHRGQSPGPKRDIRRIDPSCAGLTFADLSDAPLGPAYLRPAYLPGAQLLLDACAEPEVERIILLDAPAVLGWEAWRAPARPADRAGPARAAVDGGPPPPPPPAPRPPPPPPPHP